MLTKDRVGAALAAVAAVIGLVLVFHGRGADKDDDDAPVAPATSQVGPPPSGQLAPEQDGQVQPPGSVQNGPAAPPSTPADKDDDDDDDDG